MYDVEISNYYDMSDTHDTITLDYLENTFVNISCELPTDMSYVKVSGWIAGELENYHIEFTLDDMRSITDYSIYKFD